MSKVIILSNVCFVPRLENVNNSSHRPRTAHFSMRDTSCQDVYLDSPYYIGFSKPHQRSPRITARHRDFYIFTPELLAETRHVLAPQTLDTNCLTLCKHWCRVSTLGAPPTSWWAAVAGRVALAWAGVSLWAVHVRLK